MRTVYWPEPITIQDQTITFDAFIRDALCDPRFGVDLASVKLARSILDKLEDDEAFGISLPDHEWSALVAVLEKPSRPYDPRVAVHMMPFFDAVLSAKLNAPE